jgi:hypothetical protein
MKVSKTLSPSTCVIGNKLAIIDAITYVFNLLLNCKDNLITGI